MLTKLSFRGEIDTSQLISTLPFVSDDDELGAAISMLLLTPFAVMVIGTVARPLKRIWSSDEPVFFHLIPITITSLVFFPVYYYIRSTVIFDVKLLDGNTGWLVNGLSASVIGAHLISWYFVAWVYAVRKSKP